MLTSATVKLTPPALACLTRCAAASFSVSAADKKSYKLVVVGGGAGGCATAAKFSSKLGRGAVAVIEPSDVHYYQPLWTLVGGGMKDSKDSAKPMAEVLPKKADWIRQKAVSFHPKSNKVKTEDGQEISYEFLVVAMGLQLNYHLIKGLPEAFETPGVGSNYSIKYVDKTFEALRGFEKGNAVFTLPNTPIKCAGAPQKIMYIADEYLRKNNKRDDAKIFFNTSLGVLFGVKKYADSLWKLVASRNITVNLRHNLIEVKPESKEAIFQHLDEPDKLIPFKYEMLHVTPPMSAPDSLRNCKELVDTNGYLNISKTTLQHVEYKNIFGVGDCTNLPTSKTAAAVAGQMGVLRKNLSAALEGKAPQQEYDGYTSCPLVTGYSKCILAEFDYDGNPLETFPVNQAMERRMMFHMKKDLMPPIYWRGLVKGYWEGPEVMRKAMHLGFGK